MENKKVRQLLEELHGELESADPVEPETRNLLKSVMDDINGVLDRREASSPEEEEEPLSERLSQALTEFESQHPRVAFAVERLMKSLADIGI